MSRRTVSLLAAGLILGVASAGAQLVPLSEAGSRPGPRSSGAFGGEIQERMIAVAEFTPALASYNFSNAFGTFLRPSVAGLQKWIAPLGLPAGAIVEEILLLVEDEDAVEDIVGSFVFTAQAADGAGDCDAGYIETQWTGHSTGLSGRGFVSMQGPAPYLILGRAVYPPGFCTEEMYLIYSIAVDLNSASHGLAGAVVRWRRSVSPAPDTATFGDVPTDHPLFQFVEALAASGITAGCGSGNFCPNNPLTRGQMAVFLSIALGLHWPQ